MLNVQPFQVRWTDEAVGEVLDQVRAYPWPIQPDAPDGWAFGGDAKDAFDLIVPSLPGFGFSSKPTKPIGQRTTARLFNTLMTEVLGHKAYLAQGGDWGAMVTSWLGRDHGESAKALHLNMLG